MRITKVGAGFGISVEINDHQWVKPSYYLEAEIEEDETAEECKQKLRQQIDEWINKDLDDVTTD